MTPTHETNTTRANFGRNALTLLMQSDDDEQTALIDLLTNLRHLCHRDGLDSNHALDWSLSHYHEELKKGEPTP